MGVRRHFFAAAALACALALPASTANALTTPSAARPSQLRVPVLTYHRIAPRTEIGNSLPGLVLSPQIFESHMRALQKDGWRTVTAATLADHIQRGVRLPKKTMVITIDDGRDDGYTYALPILQRLGFVATFYVITGRIGRARYLTVPQLQTMALAGMEIANHTLSHTGNNKNGTYAYYLDQVRVAQEQLTEWLGAPPVTFAYPFGLHPKNLIRAVSNTGLRLAFTTKSGHVHTARNALTAPRMGIRASLTPRQVVLLLNSLR